MTKEEIIDIVQKYIKKNENRDWPLEILEEGVRQEEDWWYVPVRPGNKTNRNIAYYDLLSETECELQDTEHLNVLLIPSAPDEQLAQ